MSGNCADLQVALEQARKIQENLDRKIFHLKTLYDLSMELSPIIQIQKLLDTFLLTTMGTFGIGRGWVLLLDRETKTVRSSHRNTGWKGELDAEGAEKLVYRCFGASESRSLTPMSVTGITAPRSLFAEAGFVTEVEIGLMFVIDPSLIGIMGFGPTLSGTTLSREEEEILFTQTVNFMVFLKNAGSFETIQALNEDLQRRNEELRQTIAELTEARYRINLLEKARAQFKAIVQREMERTDRVSFLDLVLIFVVSLSVGLLFNYSNPNGIPLLSESLFRPHPPLIEVEEAKKHLDEGRAVLVDARPTQFYHQKRIKDSLNVPPALFDIIYMMKLSDLDPEKEIIVYGRNISKRYDEEVAHRLKQRDHENVTLLSGGLSAWEKRGYPVER